MKIAVLFRQDVRNNKAVPCYAQSYVEAFQAMGHEVVTTGEGHSIEHFTAFSSSSDLVLEIENGRNERGDLRFQYPESSAALRGVRSAVLLIDSHGHPDLHELIAREYDHVFFAVWSRRDLFAKHKSAHWCPNATDLQWFGHENFMTPVRQIDVGFFGSKRGLVRADSLVRICQQYGWTYDVREVVKPRRPRWPATGGAMACCRVLYNRGQKHDGPNQRVMESMAMRRPLLNDVDESSGMDKLFVAHQDYMPYDSDSTLFEALRTLLENPALAEEIGARGHAKVISQHLVKHRAAQILEALG